MAIKFSQFNLRTDHTSGMYLVGYDGNQNIHITVDNLFDDFINGTENTIAMFGTDGTVLADSILSQDAGATILTVAGQLNVDAAATFDTSLTVTGDSTLNGNVTLGDASADLITQTGTLYLNGPVKDTTDTLGAVDQVLLSDATGELTFTDLSDLHVGGAEVVEVPVKNAQGSALVKGDPVYISGSVGASGKLEVQLADASNTLKMPAVGLLKQDLANNAEGFAVVTGKLRNLITDPIDGVNPTENDVVYVKPGGTSGAALTTTKPVYGNFIQNIGKVGRVSTSNDGNLVVSSILRTNDIPNLTPGRLWVGSTGNTIESQTLFVDEANTRLGIGLTDPNGKLDVATTTNADVFNLRIHNLTSSSPQSTGILFNTGYTSASRGKGGLIYHYDNTNYGWNRGDFHFLQHTGNNAANPTLSDSVLVIKNTGNVGIGTDLPATKLDVDGDLTSRGDIIIDAAIGDPFLKLKTPDQEYVLRIDRSDNEKFQIRDITNSATRLTLDTSGNIGSGTTTPFANLHIKDEANNPGILVESSQVTGENFQNSYINLRATETSTSTTASGIISIHGVNTLNAAGPKTLQIRNLSFGGADVLITTYDNTNTALNPARFKSSGQVQFEEYGSGAFTGTAAKTLAVDASGNIIETAGVSVDGSGTANYVTKWLDTDTITDSVIYDDGTNVGIGTITPRGKLEVDGEVYVRTPNGIDYLKISDVSVKIGDYNDANGYAFLDLDSNVFKFTTDSAEVMRITSSGNVGINTNSPSAKLEVAGVDGNFQTTGHQIFLTKNGVNEIYANSGVQYGSAKLAFGTENNERMRINSTGYIGIATTNPIHRLQIGDGSGSESLQVSAGSTSALYLSTPNSTAQSIIGFGNNQFATINTRGRIMYQSDTAPAANYMQFTVAFNEVMRLTSDSLGIGTTSPSQKLDVAGNIGIDESIIHNGDIDTKIGFVANDNFAITTAGTERVRVTSGGSVGIGTNNPVAKLQVLGGVQVADDSATATADRVGTLRYRTSGNNSYVDMCMQTGASTYVWVNIVENNW